MADLIKRLLELDYVDFGDGRLFFRDLVSSLEHPFYPEVPVGWMENQPELLCWTDCVSDYTLQESAVATDDGLDDINDKALILESEGEPLGDYLLDIYDLHLHSLLEGDVDLAAAAKKLTTIDWANNYPPAQFIPSDQLNAIMDGALFHNQVRTDSYIEGNAVRTPRFGEVFLAPELVGQATSAQGVLEPDGNASGLVQHSTDASIEKKQVDAAEANPVTVPAIPAAHDPQVVPVPLPAPVEKSRRHAYIVLSQACDLQHCETDRLLVLRGDVSKYRWNQHDRKVQTRTPIMRLDNDELSIDWDTATPETWLLR